MLTWKIVEGSDRAPKIQDSVEMRPYMKYSVEKFQGTIIEHFFRIPGHGGKE